MRLKLTIGAKVAQHESLRHSWSPPGEELETVKIGGEVSSFNFQGFSKKMIGGPQELHLMHEAWLFSLSFKKLRTCLALMRPALSTNPQEYLSTRGHHSIYFAAPLLLDGLIMSRL
jgi:hypothetical protein